MKNFFKNYGIIALGLFVLGIISLIANLIISYELSFSKTNTEAYEVISKLKNYPKPLLIFSEKNVNDLNENDLSETQEWLDSNNSSKSKVEIKNNDLSILVLYDGDFELLKYLNKVNIIPKTMISEMEIDFLKKEIKLILLVTLIL